MGTLLTFAFISGFVTILAPCIWPLLPIVFSASSGGGKQRPLGLALGIITSFAVLTLSIAAIQKIIPVDPNIFRLTAVVIISLLGLVMIFPWLSARLEGFVSRLTGSPQGPGGTLPRTASGFAGGFGTGACIGMVWAPCAGPILATVATLAATRAVNTDVVLVTLAYVCGLGIPLFLFSLTGSVFFSRMRQLNRFTGKIQQIFGVIMILSAFLIYTNYDKAIQTRILDAFPAYGSFLNHIEDRPEVNASLAALSNRRAASLPMATDPRQLPDQGVAPEFIGISHWLNTPKPLSIDDLKGKVVLVDFWTYSCINCVRTLPHVTGWYEKYKNEGFTVIGVHTPEFAFEKETGNVARALRQFNINYPVAQDNDYKTWQAYDNHYWPAHFLIDARGHIREIHFGEGNYDGTEAAIRALLQEAGHMLETPVQAQPTEGSSDMPLTPESYLGLARLERFASKEKPVQGQQTFTLPVILPQDALAFGGPWRLSDESARPGANAVLEIQFKANRVFLVISPGKNAAGIRVFLDGKLLADGEAGADVRNGELRLDMERLYHLVALKDGRGSHRLRLEFSRPGVAVYAFTFG